MLRTFAPYAALRLGTRDAASRLIIGSFAIAAGCERNETAPPQQQPAAVIASNTVYEVGQTATTAFYSLRVLHVTTCSVEPHLQPPPGVRRLGVEVELEATTTAKVPVNPFYALVSDRNGERYETTLAGCTPVLAAAQISQGERARGWISFDVPEAMAGARLSYAPAVLGGGRPEVTFALEP